VVSSSNTALDFVIFTQGGEFSNKQSDMVKRQSAVISNCARTHT